MQYAFASIVQARPLPDFGRPVHLVRLQPGTAPQALRIRPHERHPALRTASRAAREALPPRLDIAPCIRAPVGLEPTRLSRCPAHTISASDSLSHPLARDGPSWHCPASLGHRTRQGLTGSVQNLSERAIPNHSTGLAGVFTHSALRLHGNPKPLRQRTSPPTEGWSSLPSHHGFTVRYGSLVCLRPTRFHLTVDTLPLLAIPLEWGNLQEQDFHLQASVPASRTVGRPLTRPAPQ